MSLIGMNEIFLLINQRLYYMEDIAAYKAEKQLAIEDVEQEKRILRNAMLLAEQKGITPNSIGPFFSALIHAAKLIQCRYQSDWQKKSITKKHPQNLAQMRYKLIQLNASLIERLYQALIAGQKFDKTTSGSMIKMIHHPQLSETYKRKIVTALQAIHLSQ
ncbi:gamma subclass chorismate mutase AroQ [Candidatus Williamhamiltonella defendens]|uniref:chorismate mutase n=1 Tax=Candidatus Williamhamiltonella defendens TaxID=138072 RepID=A0A2D3TB36_9ENTR|nr:gamma subclass chorismate mutase AroQ [Candidatus Hamiltonella defensa]ATW32995.1 chorismate mutase [Candidatus Hamiltonella defensa]